MGGIKKIVAVNASPRKQWNTASLVRAAADGAAGSGCEVSVYDLYGIGKYSGCISCFGCKTKQHYGKCICNDALKPILDEIREADGLIIGTPNYLGEASAAFRAIYERLIFQYTTYNRENPNCNGRKIPVLFIMTSNAGDMAYEPGGFYRAMVDNYRAILSRVIGPTEVLIAADTQQVKDYSRYDWTLFDAESKIKRHNEIFPKMLEAAKEAGRRMAQ